MSYEVVLGRETLYRIVLDDRYGETMLYLFETAESTFPEIDQDYPSLAAAMAACQKLFGIKEAAWTKLPDRQDAG